MDIKVEKTVAIIGYPFKKGIIQSYRFEAVMFNVPPGSIEDVDLKITKRDGVTQYKLVYTIDRGHGKITKHTSTGNPIAYYPITIAIRGMGEIIPTQVIRHDDAKYALLEIILDYDDWEEEIHYIVPNNEKAIRQIIKALKEFEGCSRDDALPDSKIKQIIHSAFPRIKKFNIPGVLRFYLESDN